MEEARLPPNNSRQEQTPKRSRRSFHITNNSLQTDLCPSRMEDLRELSSVEDTGVVEIPLFQLDDDRALPATSTSPLLVTSKHEYLDDEEEDEGYQPRYIRRFQDRDEATSSEHKATSHLTFTPAESNSREYPGYNRDGNKDCVDPRDDLLDSNAPFEGNHTQYLSESNGAGYQNQQHVNHNLNKEYDDSFPSQGNASRSHNVWSRYGSDAFPVAQEDFDDPSYDPDYDVSDYAASGNAGRTSVLSGRYEASKAPRETALHVAGDANTSEADIIAERLEHLHQHDRERDRLITVSFKQSSTIVEMI